MSKKTAKNTENSTSVNASVIEMYQNLVSEVADVNVDGVNFILETARMISAGEVTAREIRASIESLGKFDIAPVIKASHAEILEVAAKIIIENDCAGAPTPLVSKVLSLATRVKRGGVEIKSNETFAALDERTPSVAEIAAARKEETAKDEPVEIAVPTIDALVIGFVAELKKMTKGKLDTAAFTEASTPALEEMKVIMTALTKNRKKSQAA